jgi:cupin fold WbuC family metalloprotein
MEKYYSKVEDGKSLHIIHRFEDAEIKRLDIVPSDNFIQCSFLKLENSKTFKPHKHIKKERTYKEQIAQESWIVIKGSVRCIFYDLNDEILDTPVLNAGDASFTLAGGHNYEILEEGTIVYEYKTGPYEGQKFDKEFLQDK